MHVMSIRYENKKILENSFSNFQDLCVVCSGITRVNEMQSVLRTL